jgi:PAS domain S-box-containing protein
MAKTGRYRTLDVLTTIARSPSGGVAYLIYVTDEPHPSKRHEPQRETERFFIQLLDDLHELAVVRTDERGNITGWNAGASRLLGYSKDEIIGKNRRVLYRDSDYWDGRSTDHLKNVAESGRLELEDWRVGRDGNHLWVKTSITPMRIDGAVRGYVETLSVPPPAVRRHDPAQLEQLRADLEKERRTNDTLRSALDEFRFGSEETMNELRIMTAALRKEMERRKSLEEELRRLHEAIASAPEPETVVEEEIVEEEIIEPELPPALVWRPLEDPRQVLLDRTDAASTGTLLVRWGEQRKEVFFEKGRIFSCASNDPSKFLAQRLLERNTISEEQRRRALEIKKETDLPLGRILLILDAITEEQLVAAMREKVEGEIAELLEWREAEWSFEDGSVPSLKLVPLRIDADELLGELARKALPVIVASTKSGKMHRDTCPSAKRMSAAARVVFDGESAAEAAGFARCRQCFK